MQARGLGDGHHLTRPVVSGVLDGVTSFVFELRPDGDSELVIIALAGELDLTNAGELEERLEPVVSVQGSRVVLDVRRVTFIDSAALHVLFRTARGLGKERFELVVEPDSTISRTFEIVKISDVATISGSVDDLRPVSRPREAR